MQANMLEHAILSRSTRWRAPLAARLIYSPIKYPRCVRNRLKSSEIYVKHKKVSHRVFYMCVPSIPPHQPVPSPITHHHPTTRQPDPPNPIPGNSPCINCAEAKGRNIVFHKRERLHTNVALSTQARHHHHCKVASIAGAVPADEQCTDPHSPCRIPPSRYHELTRHPRSRRKVPQASNPVKNKTFAAAGDNVENRRHCSSPWRWRSIDNVPNCMSTREDGMDG